VTADTHWIRPPGPVAPGLRIGLLGGSFNPAHEGHVHASEAALKRLRLDYVWWLVTPRNPLKGQAGLAPLGDRVRRARDVARHPRIVVTGIEQCLRTAYTVDTVKALQRRFPELRFVWLMGSDNLETFRRWRRWEEIVARIPLAVIQRPGSTLATLHAKPMRRFLKFRRRDLDACMTPPAIVILDGPRNSLSSTALRARAGGTGLGARDSTVLNSRSEAWSI
jgi:nicotinate-nucleotide adenylyltransferase